MNARKNSRTGTRSPSWGEAAPKNTLLVTRGETGMALVLPRRVSADWKRSTEIHHRRSPLLRRASRRLDPRVPRSGQKRLH